MSGEQAEQFHRMNNLLDQATDQITTYWISYSNMGTWQFWTLLLLLVAPLAILAYAIDRRHAVLIGFYGFNVHAWFHYCDLYTSTHALTSFPYKLLPFMPVSVTLDTSLVPIAYMLTYQWTLRQGRNYYAWSAFLSAAFAFGFKPLLATLDLFWMSTDMNYYLLFIFYVLIAWVSYWITNLFRYAEKGKLGIAARIKR